jgi:cytochrome c oxidase subunit III
MTTAVIETFPPHHKDHEGARIGMWLFLFTEVLLFGGFFLLYAVYRSNFPEDFHFSAANLDTFMGGLNTVILLTSSLTMVLAVAHLERKNRKLAAIFLSATIIFAFVFLVNKFFEWSAKIHHGLYPNSEIMQTHTPGENVFYSLYYLMTGLHGIHIIVGIILLGWLLIKVLQKPRRKVNLSGFDTASLSLSDESGNPLWSHDEKESVSKVEMALVYEENEDVLDRLNIKLENAGLYWHLVDVIWIFLFPLFYLIT